MDIEQEATELAADVLRKHLPRTSQARAEEEPLPHKGIPDKVHYRYSRRPEQCRNCLHFKNGYCEEFGQGVNPDAVCDAWHAPLSQTWLGG